MFHSIHGTTCTRENVTSKKHEPSMCTSVTRTCELDHTLSRCAVALKVGVNTTFKARLRSHRAKSSTTVRSDRCRHWNDSPSSSQPQLPEAPCEKWNVRPWRSESGKDGSTMREYGDGVADSAPMVSQAYLTYNSRTCQAGGGGYS